MATNSTISVRFNDNDLKMKEKIRELKESEVPGNPYFRRSESEIVKLLLRNTLDAEHSKFAKAL